ncbi:MAG: hydroxysqualene dehydroxylase HpnE [Myxococcota bacterium]
MTGAPRVAVVGGGLAGLRAAVTCTDAGAEVRLFEARARLGGATWSTRKRGLVVDNGQHVFMRCCTAYRSFLDRLGVAEQAWLQDRLAVPVAAPGGPRAWIRRQSFPAPAHLGASLLRFPYLRPAERVRAGVTALRVTRLDPDDERLDRVSFGSWLHDAGVRSEAERAFWDLLIRPTLNLPGEEASLALAVKVLRTGFLDTSDAADIGFAAVPFEALHADPARQALERAGARIETRAAVSAIDCHDEGVRLRVQGAEVEADALVLATPPEVAAELAPDVAGLDRHGLAQLGRSAIVNLHLWFDRPVLDVPFLAGWNTPLQWIFDRTRAADVDRGQVLTVSLSAGDEWLGKSNAALREIFLPALHALLPASREAKLLEFFAVNEPAATFRQAPGCRSWRPKNATKHPRLWLAGNWTDTGWPATMESAVRSGEDAAQGLLRRLGTWETSV